MFFRVLHLEVTPHGACPNVVFEKSHMWGGIFANFKQICGILKIEIHLKYHKVCGIFQFAVGKCGIFFKIVLIKS